MAASSEANGGAWQTGVPSSGNGAPSDRNRSTEVAIEEENLTIDLHQEFAAVEVRYRMRNTGAKVLQDFFFPVELWTHEDLESEGPTAKPADLEGYRITADETELRWKNIDSQAKAKPVTNEHWGEFPPAKKLWKKSEIPFAPNQSREIVVRYRARYSGTESSVSDDGHESDRLLIYSLSPAATWKGAIGRGKLVVNVLHPTPEEVEIAQPKERFQKVSETRYEWSFRDLEPTLADDLKIIAHRAQDTYARSSGGEEGEEQQPVAEYIVQGSRYYLLHADFDAVASSTLPPANGKTYDIGHVKSNDYDVTWAEGAPEDGIGESISLEVKRPLPLDAIAIVPGYRSFDHPELWKKNNRVAEMEVTLNGEHTVSAKIPDEEFEKPYPILVRDYAAPVKKVKLVIKAVHRGTVARDTCISSLRLKAKLASKPEFQPAR
jgi:hypothetical protein